MAGCTKGDSPSNSFQYIPVLLDRSAFSFYYTRGYRGGDVKNTDGFWEVGVHVTLRWGESVLHPLCMHWHSANRAVDLLNLLKHARRKVFAHAG